MLQDRTVAARTLLSHFGADVFLFSSLPNIRYLTGFTGSNAAFVLSQESGCLFTDARYTLQASLEVLQFPSQESRCLLEGVSAWVAAAGFKSVCFEPNDLSWSSAVKLQDSLQGVVLVPAGEGLDLLRCRKDLMEVEQLELVAGLSSDAFVSILSSIKPGATERALALSLEYAMRERGADGVSFDFIVASGERGALPHGRASSKEIQRGELVTFDFGAVMEGYCSDETVTLCVGTPEKRQADIYQVVKDAHDFAIDAVRPGVPLKQLDELARSHIERHGYGSYFGHGLGHGLGIQVHEGPTVSSRSNVCAEEGMVFTIEPGIYIPGWGGVRIEDTVVVTTNGCRLLTKVPKDLMTV